MILIAPTHYFVRGHDNPYIQEHVDISKAKEQHHHLASLLPSARMFNSPHRDAVFVANSALVLHGLPRVVLLSHMKYAHRNHEIPIIRNILHSLQYTTFKFPSSHVFEGQGEAFWFGNTLFCGYGYRSTRSSCAILQHVLHKIYSSYHKPTPLVVPLRLEDSRFYHLDIAMLKLSDTECIVHADAFSSKTIQTIKSLIPVVHVITTSNTLCLNAIVYRNTLITNQLSVSDQRKLESITHLPIVQVNTSAFNASGGGVRCMILDL